MGEKLTVAERKVFRQFTGREKEPGARIEEGLFLIGRRGGKDRAAAVVATYLAALVDWSGVLAKGETGLVLCVGADKMQATVQRNYIEGVFDGSAMLSSLLVGKTADAIELTSSISIEVRAANLPRTAWRGIERASVRPAPASFCESRQACALHRSTSVSRCQHRSPAGCESATRKLAPTSPARSQTGRRRRRSPPQSARTARRLACSRASRTDFRTRPSATDDRLLAADAARHSARLLLAAAPSRSLPYRVTRRPQLAQKRRNTMLSRTRALNRRLRHRSSKLQPDFPWREGRAASSFPLRHMSRAGHRTRRTLL
jgi:hypothetical protein